MDDLTGAVEQKKKIEDRAKRLADREASDLKKVWNIPEGRRYMLKLIKSTGYIEGGDVPTGRDAIDTGKKIGRWGFGHAIVSAAHKVAPDLYHLAEREALSDKLLLAQEIKNGQQGG